MNDLTSSVPNIIQISIEKFYSYILSFIIALITLWMVDYRFAIFMLVWAILFIIVASLFSKKLVRQADTWAESYTAITGKLVDSMSNILSVRLFTAKLQERKSLRETIDETVVAEQKMEWSYFYMWSFYGYSFFLLQALSFYILCKGRQEGWITVGDFALVLVINLSILDFMWRIA